MFSGRPGGDALLELAVTSLVFAALLFLVGLKQDAGAARRAPLINLESGLRRGR